MIFGSSQPVSPALTTGDFLSIAAICAVIVIALLTPIWAYLRKTRKRVKQLEQTVGIADDDDQLYRRLVAATAERGFVGTANSLEFLAGSLQRSFEGRLNEVDAKRALGKLRSHRSEVERAWMELRLLTGDRAEQTSALQQLERLGDRRTVRNMELQLADDASVVERERFERAIETIRERMDAEDLD